MSVTRAFAAGLVQDARYAVRMLRRQPGVALVAMLTMALGIGATTTLFSVAYGVLLKPLPWPDAGRLVRVTEARGGREARVAGTMSNGPYHGWAAGHSTIDAIGGWLRQAPSTMAIAGGEPSLVQTAAVTPSLFAVLSARPLAGRLFVDADVPPAAPQPSFTRAVILSYGLWQERFGAADDAIGRVVQVDGKPVTVVGVMPKTFAFPDRETRAWTPWLPPVVHRDGVLTLTIFSALARLRQGATREQAAAEGTARARAAPDLGVTAVALFGTTGPAEIRVVPAIDLMTAEVRPALLVLLAAVALLLVTATANVASVQLARAAARRREIAIRAAIGAGTARLARQLVVESTIIGAGGGAAGVALAFALHRAFGWLLPADFPRADAVAVDWRVLIFAAAVSTAAGVACGLLPAWHARRVDLIGSLAGDGSAQAMMPAGAARTRLAIMAGQLAVSCVLLVGAALLARSFAALLRADRGYDPSNVLTARVSFPPGSTMERRTALLERVVERVGALPGVRAAAYGNALPLLMSGGFRGFRMRPPVDPSVEVDVNVIQRVVSPGYFAALGLRVTAGRALSAADTLTSSNAIVVNRSFAARYLGAAPLGAVVPNLGMCRGNQDRWEVVGVVDDMRQSAAFDRAEPEVFVPARQAGCANALNQAIVAVRTSGDPLLYAATLRRAVREQDPWLPVDSVTTLEDRVTTALARPRLYAVVLAGFSAFAVAIAAVGVFGVLSYSVAQRSREIGVRTALGARPSDIVRLVLRQATIVAAAGIGAGLWIAYALSSALAAVLYGVNPHDGATFAAAAVALALVAALACLVPARRAARVDPLDAMR